VALGEVIDYVGGRTDLEAHRIATIGDPEIRMREDPVRALRAVRFAARLGFTIAPDTFAAMKRHASEIGRCAPPRVLEEIFKILRCGASGRAFELLRASGALQVILPALFATLEASGEEGRRRFGAHLAALDRLVRSGAEVSEAVLLGALLMHLRAPSTDAEGEAQDDPAQALLGELVDAARLPRRVAERTRLALHAQRTVRAPAQKRRRRRRGGFAAQAYFEDALALLELAVEATGEGREALERWKAESAPKKEHGHGHPRAGHGAGHGAGHERDARERRDEGALGPEAELPLEADEALLSLGAAADRDDADADDGEDGDDPQPDDVEARGLRDAGAPGEGAAAGEKSPGDGGRKRRRRRGGRRRRRRGGGAHVAATATTEG
jgi:poly(A) polymerase